MKNYSGLFLIFLCIVVIITAGCISPGSTSAAPVATPTPQVVYVTVLVTPTPAVTVARARDPIIGVWRYSSSGYDFRDRFNADGTFIRSSKDPATQITSVLYGTWNAQGGNSYIINLGSWDLRTYMYDPEQNTYYNTEFPSLLYTPYQGDVAAASSTPASTPTYSSSSSSGSTHFTGYGDDVQSFTATGSGLRIFTMRYTGNSNFAIILKDGNGKYLALLVNEIGSYSGKKSQSLTSGKYYLDVTASGPWTVDISSV